MPRKTHVRTHEVREGRRFNEAAARCRGKLPQGKHFPRRGRAVLQ